MFTGIIECLGRITDITTNGSNKTFWIKSPVSGDLRPDESVSHNGVCLTIEEITADSHKVTAIKETIDKTNVKVWELGNSINLERAMRMNGRIDGHIVQGHIDTTATCTAKKVLKGSTE